MAEDRTGSEELLRLLADYKSRHGEENDWLLLALALVYLGQMIRLVELRAAAGPAAAQDTGTKGLGDLLGVLGPLLESFKPAPRPAGPPAAKAPPVEQPRPETTPPEEPRPEDPPPEESLPQEPRPARHGVIQWDPRLIGGGRK